MNGDIFFITQLLIQQPLAFIQCDVSISIAGHLQALLNENCSSVNLPQSMVFGTLYSLVSGTDKLNYYTCSLANKIKDNPATALPLHRNALESGSIKKKQQKVMVIYIYALIDTLTKTDH